jgi:hypothetical protein
MVLKVRTVPFLRWPMWDSCAMVPVRSILQMIARMDAN